MTQGNGKHRESEYPRPISASAATAVREYSNFVWRAAWADPDWQRSNAPQETRLLQQAMTALYDDALGAQIIALHFRSELGIAGQATEGDAFRLAEQIPNLVVLRTPESFSSSIRGRTGTRVDLGQQVENPANDLAFHIGIAILCGDEFIPPAALPPGSTDAEARTWQSTWDALSQFRSLMGSEFARAFLEGIGPD